MGFIEYIGYTFFQTLPLYWLGKCLFLIWLMIPGAKGGSDILYRNLLRPFLPKSYPNVEKSVQEGNLNMSIYSISNFFLLFRL